MFKVLICALNIPISTYFRIDYIHLRKRNISESEKMQIIDTFFLHEYTKDGETFYSNYGAEEVLGGLKLHINTKNELNMHVSAHKYYNYHTEGKAHNYNAFNMKQARRTLTQIVKTLGIAPQDIQVKKYETGLNIALPVDTKQILDKIRYIGNNRLKIYVNPRYKDERALCTEFSKSIRKYYKAYDKIQEMKDKGATHTPSGHILRIETVHNRVERLNFLAFLDMLETEEARFFNDWKGVKFDINVKSPKGANIMHKDLVKKIYSLGVEAVKVQTQREYMQGLITYKQKHKRDNFINQWHEVKSYYQPEALREENIFKLAFKEAKKALY